jgi:hypothetical protein
MSSGRGSDHDLSRFGLQDAGQARLYGFLIGSRLLSSISGSLGKRPIRRATMLPERSEWTIFFANF